MTIAPAMPSLLEGFSDFSRATKAVSHRVDRLQTSVRRNDASLLRYLERAGQSRAGDIAAEFGVDASVISRQIGCLIDLDYVGRTPDPADARASLLALTERGRDALTEFDRIYAGFLADLFDDWSEERIRRSADVLEELAAKLFGHSSTTDPHITREKKDS